MSATALEKKFRQVYHNPRRKRILVNARPIDAAGEVVVIADPNFNMDTTIFQTLQSPIRRWLQTARLSRIQVWDEDVVGQINDQFKKIESKLPRSVSVDAAIWKFMATECVFQREMNDKTFLEHYNFIYDYVSLYYKSSSSRVMLLHATCGYVTNYFPMAAEKLPMLRSLIKPDERDHVEGFPSVNRLFIATDLLAELTSASTEELLRIKSVSMHRVLDNGLISLTGKQFWVHMNYQLIHMLDFIPLTSWTDSFENELLAANFVNLHALLLRVGKLEAKVEFDFEAAKGPAPGSFPPGCANKIIDCLPSCIVFGLTRQTIQEFSERIGHSLDYTIEWSTPPVKEP